MENFIIFRNKEINNNKGNVNENYIYIEGYGGIYIPDYSNVKYNLTENKFLEIYISHGKKFDNKNYIYMIFPNISKENLETYKNYFEILNNDDNIIVIKDKRTNIIEYIFFKSGEFGDLKVDHPCVLIRDKKNIYISDPTHLLEYIVISIGNNKHVIRVYKGLTSTYKIK